MSTQPATARPAARTGAGLIVAVLADALAASRLDAATAATAVAVNAGARLDVLVEAFGVTALLAAGP